MIEDTERTSPDLLTEVRALRDGDQTYLAFVRAATQTVSTLNQILKDEQIDELEAWITELEAWITELE